MDEQELYRIVEYILNKADTQELNILQEALTRRIKDDATRGYLDPRKERMAGKLAASISKQISYNMTDIRAMVRTMVAQMIQEKAPELSDTDIHTLLDAWVPDPAKQKKSLTEEEAASKIPTDVLCTMVRQFINFSTNTMSATHRIELENQIPDWQHKYWEMFPIRIKKLIYLFLEEKIDAQAFWSEVKKTLSL